MARRPDTRQATETLHEIESALDRVAHWVTTNPVRVLGTLGAILAVAASIGLYDWYSDSESNRAALAVAEVQSGYLRAMGAAPGSFDVPEPANPETGRQVRREYVERFLEVAQEHGGTTAAVSALLEAGTLLEQAGEPNRAIEVLERAREQAGRRSELRGLTSVRLARAFEQQGRWAEAAPAHAEAGAIESYPARSFALADAARCWLEAGEPDKALAAFDELEALKDAPKPPDHVVSRLQELRALRERP